MSRRKSKKASTKPIVLIISLILLAVISYFGLENDLNLPWGENETPTASIDHSTQDVQVSLPPNTHAPDSNDPGSILYAYFVDVGQGDCIFLRSPSGKTMLIDCGEYSEYEAVESFLEEQNVSKLDVVVATHPHSDHMGGMRLIIQNYDIGTFYMPDKEHTTNAYEKMIEHLLEKDVDTVFATAGNSIDWDDEVEAMILSPIEGVKYSDLNSYSIAIRFEYGEMSLLVAGDAERDAEELMLERFTPDELRSTVFKASHHGSSTSNSEEFLNAIDPECVVIQLGANNDYGHPHEEVLDRFFELYVDIYRNDIHGTVLVELTKQDYNVICEKDAA